jgi:hypothetical protein
MSKKYTVAGVGNQIQIGISKVERELGPFPPTGPGDVVKKEMAVG